MKLGNVVDATAAMGGSKVGAEIMGFDVKTSKYIGMAAAVMTFFKSKKAKKTLESTVDSVVDKKIIDRHSKIADTQAQIVADVKSIVDRLDKQQGQKSNTYSVIDLLVGLDKEKQKDLRSSIDILQSLVDWLDKQSSKFANQYASVVDVLVNSATKIDAHKDKFDSMNTVLSTINETFTKFRSVGVSLLTIALGITAIGVAIYTLTHTVDTKGALAAVGILSALELFMYATSKLKSDNISDVTNSMVKIAAAVALLSISIVILEHAGGLKGIALVALTIVALGAAVAITNKFTGGADVMQKYGIGIITMSASIAVLALSIKLWDVLDIGISTTAIAMGGFLVLAAGLTALSKFGGPGNIILTATSLIIASAAVGVLAYAISMFKDVTIEDSILAGAAFAVVTVGLYALGTLGPIALMGAGALLLGSVSMLILAKGIEAMPDGASMSLISLSGAMIAYAGALAIIGNPVTYAFLLMGIAAAIGLGVATQAIVKGVALYKKSGITEKDARLAGTAISTIINALKQPFIDIGKSSGFFTDSDFENGVESVSGLGTIISTIAKGVTDMAELNVTSYEIKNGKLVPISVRKLKAKDFTKAGTAISSIIEAIKQPFIDIGKSGGFFTDSDFEKGVESVSGLGIFVSNLADGTAKMRKLNAKDFTKAGTAISSIIEAIKQPIIDIGKDEGWFTDSDFENGVDAISNIGDIFTPISSIIDSMFDAGITNTDKAKLYASSMQQLVVGVTSSLKLLSNAPAIEHKGLDSVSNVFSKLKNSASTALALEKINKELSADKLKRIVTLANSLERMASTKMYDAFEKLIKLLADELGGTVDNIATLLAQITDSKSTFTKAQTIKNNDGTTTIVNKPIDYNEHFTALVDGVDELIGVLRTEKLRCKIID